VKHSVFCQCQLVPNHHRFLKQLLLYLGNTHPDSSDSSSESTFIAGIEDEDEDDDFFGVDL
jgi:hypothetical protein